MLFSKKTFVTVIKTLRTQKRNSDAKFSNICTSGTLPHWDTPSIEITSLSLKSSAKVEKVISDAEHFYVITRVKNVYRKEGSDIT